MEEGKYSTPLGSLLANQSALALFYRRTPVIRRPELNLDNENLIPRTFLAFKQD